MTNKEAIEILKEGEPFSEIYNKDYEEALSLAIKALEKVDLQERMTKMYMEELRKDKEAGL